MWWIITATVLSYIIGSIPTAYIFGRLLKGVDIRNFGSGNVGATNALRVLGKPVGITVLILDILKGLVAVVFLGNLIASKVPYLKEDITLIILGIVCICGHNWTIFLRFKGGKGVATTFGVLLALAVRIPGLNLILGLVILTWLIVFIFSKIISLASVIAGVSIPAYMIMLKQGKVLVFSSVFLALFIILRHKANLKRVLQGKEPKIF